MARKGRKTRWRKLPMPMGHQNQGKATNGARSRVPVIGGSPCTEEEVETEEPSAGPKESVSRVTFNEDEYTKITTPRQDMLFKKGYLGRKKTATAARTTNHDATNNFITTEPPTSPSESIDSCEVQYCDDGLATGIPQPYLYQGYIDHNGLFYFNSGSYEMYEPYTGNVTVIVPGGYTSGGVPPMYPVPLHPLEWYPVYSAPAQPPAAAPAASAVPQPPPSASTTSAPATATPQQTNQLKKRNSTDSQNWGSSQSCESPSSPQEGDTTEPVYYSHHPYVYPTPPAPAAAFVFPQPQQVYAVNGMMGTSGAGVGTTPPAQAAAMVTAPQVTEPVVTAAVAGVPVVAQQPQQHQLQPQQPVQHVPQQLADSAPKRRKKRRKKRRPGMGEEGSESSCEEVGAGSGGGGGGSSDGGQGSSCSKTTDSGVHTAASGADSPQLQATNLSPTTHTSDSDDLVDINPSWQSVMSEQATAVTDQSSESPSHDDFRPDDSISPIVSPHHPSEATCVNGLHLDMQSDEDTTTETDLNQTKDLEITPILEKPEERLKDEVQNYQLLSDIDSNDHIVSMKSFENGIVHPKEIEDCLIQKVQVTEEVIICLDVTIPSSTEEVLLKECSQDENTMNDRLPEKTTTDVNLVETIDEETVNEETVSFYQNGENESFEMVKEINLAMTENSGITCNDIPEKMESLKLKEEAEEEKQVPEVMKKIEESIENQELEWSNAEGWASNESESPKSQPLSIETEEVWGSAEEWGVEVLPTETVLNSSACPDATVKTETRPITEAVTRWLESQGGASLRPPPPPPPPPDEESEDEGIEDDQASLSTGPKNAVSNPFPALYPSVGTRVASRLSSTTTDYILIEPIEETTGWVSERCDPSAWVDRYYRLARSPSPPVAPAGHPVHGPFPCSLVCCILQ